jgi:hypothetical protein
MAPGTRFLNRVAYIWSGLKFQQESLASAVFRRPNQAKAASNEEEHPDFVQFSIPDPNSPGPSGGGT